ncbi:hypothetical protein [Vibrio marisflavi]|uniref:Uncharacterized protein n=1 Tax=Vibrio marisflavi CECT 7928 TaxID=634439 RepID=A0ABM9A955_9VIBR|nr:hypothetical protein [Vibrio marisflavi]CAH0543011.1 hypothetical protein VMF7928_04359 [Vibrio marisflavi CECT 7928]
MTFKISRKQVPASARLLPALAPNWGYANHFLNYGCGKYPELTEHYLNNRFMQIQSVTNYDPNSHAEGVVNDINELKNQRYCVALCANVLNVCEDLEAVLADLAQIDFDCCVIQIYEGDRTGVGKPTRDGYQRNEVVADYVHAIRSNFHKFDVQLHRSRKCITILKGRKYYE